MVRANQHTPRGIINWLDRIEDMVDIRDNMMNSSIWGFPSFDAVPVRHVVWQSYV